MARPTTTVKLVPKRNNTGGTCDFSDHFPPVEVKIEVDANSAMTERFVMHELLHVVLCELVLGKFDGTLEEAFILGLENFMWDFITASPERLNRWKRLVAKKVEESSPMDPVPLLKLADRTKEDAQQK